MAKKIESLHQKAFFQWLSRWNSHCAFLTWHTPNGGKRNIREAARFKEMGVKPGVPDVFMAIPIKGYHGLFIEFKAGKNSLTESQEKMINKLGMEGYMTATCYTVEEAIAAVEHYIGVK